MKRSGLKKSDLNKSGLKKFDYRNDARDQLKMQVTCETTKEIKRGLRIRVAYIGYIC